MRGGVQPDPLSAARWSQTPLWQYAVYAVYAVVICSRASAERRTVPVKEIAWQIAARRHLDLPDTGSLH
jgi:hypothetical protein